MQEYCDLPRISSPPPATGPIDRLVIATDDLDARDRYDWWRSQFRPLHATEVARKDRASFVARGDHFRLGPMMLARYVTPARSVVRTAADIRRDDIDHLSLRVMLRGSVVSHTAQGSVRCDVGQVILQNARESYRDDYSSGEWVTLMVPRSVLPELAAARPGLFSGARAGLLADFLVSLHRRMGDATPEDLAGLTELTGAMIATCLPGAEVQLHPHPAERQTILRIEVERVIRANLASARLDTRRICALTGISRSALYRLFEGDGGVAAYIQALRLHRIDADLRDPRFGAMTIAALAARWGLHNPAAFSRAYRRTFGCTPSEARTAGPDRVAPGGDAAPLPPRTFYDLLR